MWELVKSGICLLQLLAQFRLEFYINPSRSNTEYGRIFVFIGNIIQTSNFWLLYIYIIFMFYTHILSKIMHSPNYIYSPNNSRSGPVSGDNSNKQIFILHIFRGNKQIDYRRVRQLSNLLVCRQGRKSAYYPPVTIVWFW